MHSLNFEEIVDRYYPMLYRFAYSLARQEADACDLTQQTFSVWAEKGHLLRDESKVKSWLFTTLYREFISQKRRETRWPQEDIAEVENELPSAVTETIDHLEADQVMEALHALDETFRAPLTLYYLEDHSYDEIAEILDVPIGTIMSRLSRGKKKLQQTLAERLDRTGAKAIPFRVVKGGAHD